MEATLSDSEDMFSSDSVIMFRYNRMASRPFLRRGRTLERIPHSRTDSRNSSVPSTRTMIDARMEVADEERSQSASRPASANESSTRVSQTTYVHDAVPGRGKRPFETLQEPALHFQTPSIEPSPSAIVQKDQITTFWADQTSTGAPAHRAASVSTEALDGDERPSKRRCDPRPLFKCSKCPQSFTRRTTLNNHQRQHTGDRPFRCGFSECGRSFAQNNDKKRHERSHGDEKAFQCGGSRSNGSSWGCGKAFARKDGLSEHHHKTVKGGQCLARRDAALAALDDR
jgi:hypothetical protein